MSRSQNSVLFVSALALAGCRALEENRPPVAVAAGPEQVDAGTWVQLDASESSDPDGDALNRRWTFVRLPLGSTATLNDTTIENPSFYADEPGEYTVRLVVDDGFLRSQPAAVTVTVTPINRAPTAVVGLDRNVATGAEVLLDGTASFDPDEDTLTFAWDFVSKPSGSNAALDDPTSATPTFRADLDGAYHVRLIVSDGAIASAPATLQVNASADNLPPIADAGVDQYVAVGGEVTLDGSASIDPNGSELTYAWTFTDRPTGSTAALTQDGGALATFVPDLEGMFAVALVVDDGLTSSAPDRVEVIAYRANTRPVAHAGTDATTRTGEPFQLDGSASDDDDDDLLTYAWTFTALPQGSQAVLNNPAVVRPTFTPDVDDATYTVRLDVWDGLLWSAPSFVTITATNGNQPPTAVVVSDTVSVRVGEVATLDASPSTDPEGDPLTYRWRFVEVPPGHVGGLNNDAIVNPSIVPLVETGGTPFVLTLEVSDGALWSEPVTVTVAATDANRAPVANAGTDQEVDVGTLVVLDGTASEDLDEDDVLTYHWAFTAKPVGSVATLNDATLARPSFVPDRPTGDNETSDYVLRLTVSDGSLSDTDTVVITAGNANQPPDAHAGGPRPAVDEDPILVGSPVQISGAGSADPEGAALTYQWSFTALPSGSLATLNNTAVESPSFTPDVNGEYDVRLVVSDGSLWSTPSFATITATGGKDAPTADAGGDQSVAVGDTVQLDGSLSNGEEIDDLEFTWTFFKLPSGSTAQLNDPSIVNPSFVADRAGTYEVRLRVSDGPLHSDYAYAVINATTP